MFYQMPKALSTIQKCAQRDQDILIAARNNTTTYQFFWCPACRFVHRDTNFNGVID